MVCRGPLELQQGIPAARVFPRPCPIWSWVDYRGRSGAYMWDDISAHHQNSAANSQDLKLTLGAAQALIKQSSGTGTKEHNKTCRTDF